MPYFSTVGQAKCAAFSWPQDVCYPLILCPSNALLWLKFCMGAVFQRITYIIGALGVNKKSIPWKLVSKNSSCMLKAPYSPPVICDVWNVIHNSAAFCFTEQNAKLGGEVAYQWQWMQRWHHAGFPRTGSCIGNYNLKGNFLFWVFQGEV